MKNKTKHWTIESVKRLLCGTHPGVDPFDGHQLHAALLQAVSEHGPEDRRRRGQHHLVGHKVHGLQVPVAHAQRNVTELPLQAQLVHDGEGGRGVALERVAEDPVAVARGRGHQRLAFCHALCHFPPVLLLDLPLLLLLGTLTVSGRAGSTTGHPCAGRTGNEMLEACSGLFAELGHFNLGPTHVEIRHLSCCSVLKSRHGALCAIIRDICGRLQAHSVAILHCAPPT